jgi:hypothetical protein
MNEILVPHRYFSTACLHEQHKDCRMVCKFCPSPCRCDCHDAAEQAEYTIAFDDYGRASTRYSEYMNRDAKE